jgi:hypothetical protein
MAGIIEEAKNLLDEELDEATMDAGLIAAGQRAEHYEMAAYGALVAWAKAMGQVEAAGILEEILEQEKAADKKLSSLAESGINNRAARNGSQDEEGIGEQDDDTAQAPVPNIATQAGRRRQLAQRGSLGQGNAPGRPASQLGKQVPANESVKRLQRQPGRTGSRRADR